MAKPVVTVEELHKLCVGEFSCDRLYVRASDGELYKSLRDLYAAGRIQEYNSRGVPSICGGCDLYEACRAKGFDCGSHGRWKRITAVTYANGLTEIKL